MSREDRIKEASLCPCRVCQSKKQEGIKPELIEQLIKLEDRTGKEINQHSGVRCKIYNASVGGYASSPHLTREADDISIEGYTILELAKICEEIGFKRIGIYPNHVHVDTIDPRPSRFWYVRKYGEAPIYSRGIKSLDEFLKSVKK